MSRIRLIFWLAIFAIALCSVVSASAALDQAEKPAFSEVKHESHASYLLLVSFLAGELRDFGTEKIKAINVSPYQGVAIPLIDIYDTGRYKKKDFDEAVKRLNDNSKKDIWPWIFFNRFVGYEEGQPSHSELAKAKYFGDIKGFDIYNKAGALTDFYSMLAIALDLAKDSGSPGIVIDHELYNNYSLEDITHLSSEIGKPEQEVKDRLRE